MVAIDRLLSRCSSCPITIILNTVVPLEVHLDALEHRRDARLEPLVLDAPSIIFDSCQCFEEETEASTALAARPELGRLGLEGQDEIAEGNRVIRPKLKSGV